MLTEPVRGRHGVLQGTTWGDRAGFPGFTRMRLGQHTTARELQADWTMTHEFIHLAFPCLPDAQHWMEEGLSTYIEPIARAQAGQLIPESIWSDMIRQMPQGEPTPADRGLDHTHTWGRTYWGGAMFCLVADLTIRQQTANKRGLPEAVRGIVSAGGTIDHDWDITIALQIGDTATGTTVLSDLYKAWPDKPVQVDLDKIWRVGYQHSGNTITLGAGAR